MTATPAHPPAPAPPRPIAPPRPAAAATSPPPHRRRRVLVSAFATIPDSGSEGGVGWNMATHLATHHDVTVLCFPGYVGDYRAAYERHVAAHGPTPGLTLHYVDAPPLARLLQREGVWNRATYYAGYAAWQRAALRVARELHAAEPFNLVHHLNIIGYREPGYLWRLGVPFVWGPVGGAQMMPRPFFTLLSPRDRAMYGIRNRLNARQMRKHRRCREAARAASHVWAVDAANATMMREYFGVEAERLTESGCVPMDDPPTRRYDGKRPLRLIWSGVHEGRKCLPILLHALASLDPAERSRTGLTVLGRGPETANWKRLAADLGLTDRITWAGFIPRQDALVAMHGADVLVLTSLQEGTPHVVMEALACGLPVFCHDACGMGEAVDDTCGIKVPMTDPATSIAGFAGAIRSVLDDPSRVETLSLGARRRAMRLTWAEKAARVARVYEQVIQHRAAACV